MTTICTSIDELFEKVLRELPRADEYCVLDDWRNPRFRDLLGSEESHLLTSHYCIVSGDYFDELPWGVERGIKRATYYPGDLFPNTNNKRHIALGLEWTRPDIKIWVNNSYMYAWKNVHHFGLQDQLIPPGKEAMRYRRDQGCWHVFDDEDELIQAVIDCINRRN